MNIVLSDQGNVSRTVASIILCLYSPLPIEMLVSVKSFATTGERDKCPNHVSGVVVKRLVEVSDKQI